MAFDVPLPFGMGLPQMPQQELDEVLQMVQRARRAAEYEKAFGFAPDTPMQQQLGSFFGQAAPQMAMSLAPVPFLKAPRAMAAMGGAAAGMWPGGATGQDTEIVKRLQRQLKEAGDYKGKIDGEMGEATKKAKEAFDAREATKEQQAIDRQKAQAAIRAAEAQADQAKAAREATQAGQEREAQRILEREAGNKRTQEMEESVGPVRQFLREWGPGAGLLAGAVGGAFGRKGMVGASNTSAERVAQQATQGMASAPLGVPVGPGDVATRFPPVNEFWRRGGAAEAPFTAASGTRAGVVPNPAAPTANKLYPPPGQFTKTDAAVLGLSAADVAGGYWGQYYYQDRLEKARAEAEKDPSEANLRQVQVLKDFLAGSQFGTNLGYGAAMGYAGAMPKLKRTGVQPSTVPAESEQAAINQFLRTANRNRGGMTAPAAPMAPLAPLSPAPATSVERVPVPGHPGYYRINGKLHGPHGNYARLSSGDE